MVKVSGEMLGGDGVAFDKASLSRVAMALRILSRDHEVVCVVGGGNLCRGRELTDLQIDPAVADHVGMMATMMNGRVLHDVLEAICCKTDPVTEVRLMTAHPFSQAGEPYVQKKAMHHLRKGRILILSGGSGNPFCTTDFTAALRARELGCHLILKATGVDGVYDCDPKKNHGAKKYPQISFDDAIQKGLSVMDLTAFTSCKEGNIPIRVFDGSQVNNFLAAARGEIGTLVSSKG
jgi:uridylate kinase